MAARMRILIGLFAIVLLPVTAHAQSGKRDAACLIGQDGGCVYSPLVAQRYELVLTTECGAWHDQLKADNPNVLTFVYNSGTDNYTDSRNSAYNGWYYRSREHAWLVLRCRELGYSPEILYLHYYENTVVSGFTIPGTYSSTVTDADSVSRVPVYLGYYEGSGVGRMLVNFSHPVTRQLQIEYAKKAWTDPNAGDDWPQSSYWDGIYLDNWLGNALHPGMGLTGSVTSGGRLAEHPTHAVIGSADGYGWFQDQMNLYARQLRDSLHNGAAWSPDGKAKYLCTNIANTWKNEFPDPSVAGIDYLLQEYQYNPVRSYAEDVVAAYSRDSACYEHGVHTIYAALQTKTPSSGSGSVTQAEALYGNLAWYYISRSPNTLIYQMHLDPGNFWIDPGITGWDTLSWRGCMDFDVGTSLGRYAVFQEGTDPTGQSYTIYQREYSKALVFLRARIQWNHNITPETAVQFTLPSAYRQVQIDGSLGPLSTTFSMANGRGLILAKPEGGQSEIVPPNPFDPANGEVIATLQPTLVVHNAYDAESRSLRYEFQLDGNGDFTGGDLLASSVGDISAPNGTTTAWSVPVALTDGLSYHWRCRVVTQSGAADTSNWSAIFSFIITTSQTNNCPTAPAPVAPANGAQTGNNTPALEVQNSSDDEGDALTYDFFVCSDAGMTNTVTSTSGRTEGLGTTAWTVSPPLTTGQTYYWHARAYDGECYSGWSAVYSFIVPGSGPNQPPPVPVGLSPIDGDTVSTTDLQLTVQNIVEPDGDPVRYQFALYEDGIMIEVEEEIVEGLGSTTTWQPQTPMAENMAYSWRVQCHDPHVYSGWSDHFAFVTFELVVDVGEHIPDLISPGSGVTVATLRPQFKIRVPPEALGERCEIGIAADPDFSDLLVYSGPIDVTSGIVIWTPENELTGGPVYYWQARLIGGEWSASASFVVQPDIHFAPNPYVLSDGETVTVYDLPAGAEIQLYTISGRLVITLVNENQSELIWDVTNHQGERLAPGVYLYIIRSANHTVEGKFVVSP